MDGWNNEKVSIATEVCSDIYELNYELENCIRGCYTGAHTYEELGEYIQVLAQRLMDAGAEISNEIEDPDDEEND